VKGPGRSDPIPDPLVEDPLVRRVLVDDEEPLGAGGQDVRLAMLTDRQDLGGFFSTAGAVGATSLPTVGVRRAAGSPGGAAP